MTKTKKSNATMKTKTQTTTANAGPPLRARGRKPQRSRERAIRARLLEDGDRVSDGARAGVVSKWDVDRGFGFIRPDRGGAPVFCHITAMQGLSADRDVDLQGKRVAFDKESPASRKPSRKDPQGDRHGFQAARGPRVRKLQAGEAGAVQDEAHPPSRGGFAALGEEEDEVQEHDEHKAEVALAQVPTPTTGVPSWADRARGLCPQGSEEEDGVVPWAGTRPSGTRRSWASDSDDDDE